MGLENDPVISAQVLLRSASGKKITGETVITSKNIGDYTPSSDTVAKATDALTKLGFEVGQMVGISLSISAPASTFEKVFGMPLRQGEDGGIQVLGADGVPSYEIPRTAWPKKIARLAVAVTFVPPPEYHPDYAF
jgi:hypothetical protein